MRLICANFDNWKLYTLVHWILYWLNQLRRARESITLKQISCLLTICSTWWFSHNEEIILRIYMFYSQWCSICVHQKSLTAGCFGSNGLAWEPRYFSFARKEPDKNLLYGCWAPIQNLDKKSPSVIYCASRSFFFFFFIRMNFLKICRGFLQIQRRMVTRWIAENLGFFYIELNYLYIRFILINPDGDTN